MFVLVIILNSNWETLTKNLVTFKRWDRVKKENLWYFWGFIEISNFQEGVTKNQYGGGID